MMIITLHTPTGIVKVDSETVTDEELASLGMTREIFEQLCQGQELFTPINPIMGVEPRLTHVENWLSNHSS